MLTLFDYLDPERTEARRRDQRDDAARYRDCRANARHGSSSGAATPLAGERWELLASLAEMWATKELPTRETDVLDGCPPDATPLGAWADWLPLTLASSGLLMGVVLLVLLMGTGI